MHYLKHSAALTILAAGTLAGIPARAALPVKEAARAIELMPPPAEVRMASRSYPVFTLAHTNHAGWQEASGYVNVPQNARITWHVDKGAEALLRVRDAWDPRASWQDLGKWGRGSDEPERGTRDVEINRPVLVWLRVRAPKWPRSGVATLKLDYQRRTVAVLRGTPGAVRRPVILAEGYDPLNVADWNDAAWQADPTLAGLAAQGRQRYGLDLWLVDWGDGGAPLEQQAADFAELARQIRAWNGGRRETVAAGISMGAVTLRYALAEAAGSQDGLGVQKYISINGPHQGAWISPKVINPILKHLAKRKPEEEKPDPTSAETFRIDAEEVLRRGVDSPAARQLLIGRPEHDAFFQGMQALGNGGYDPTIARVAFSNGALTKEGTDLAEWVKGKSGTSVRVQMQPLGLPFWVTIRKTQREFRYGAYPGELLPESLTRPVREHLRFLSLFRFDFRTRWEKIPTFIPTHSALDFPQELAGASGRFRYTRWRETPFPQVYVARGHNLAHDETSADWIDPRTGKAAPEGQNAVLYEIARAFQPQAAREKGR